EKVTAFETDMITLFEKTLRFINPLMLTLMRPFLGKVQHGVMRDFVRPLLDLIVKNWEKGRDLFCYRAPLVMIFHHSPLADPADPNIATTYAMLAAEALNLGSCWIGTALILNQNGDLKEKYGIPETNKVSGLLALGYPVAKFKRSVRRQPLSVAWM
ncbi:nitroreductase family protein, partial [Oligoflexia bacterium]|nr:nitroreductase family protein [Oligoflexia bacterium]